MKGGIAMYFLGIAVFAFAAYLFGDTKGYERGLDENRKLDAFWDEVGRRVK